MSNIIIHNVETGEIIEREMNSQELAQQTKDRIDANKALDNAKKQSDARAALLERLGITEEEAKLLLG